MRRPDWAPQYVLFDEEYFEFDCIGGTGEPIYKWEKESKGEIVRRHLVLVRYV